MRSKRQDQKMTKRKSLKLLENHFAILMLVSGIVGCSHVPDKPHLPLNINPCVTHLDDRGEFYCVDHRGHELTPGSWVCLEPKDFGKVYDILKRPKD